MQQIKRTTSVFSSTVAYRKFHMVFLQLNCKKPFIYKYANRVWILDSSSWYECKNCKRHWDNTRRGHPQSIHTGIFQNKMREKGNTKSGVGQKQNFTGVREKKVLVYKFLCALRWCMDVFARVFWVWIHVLSTYLYFLICCYTYEIIGYEVLV